MFQLVAGSYGNQTFALTAPSLSVDVGTGQDRLLKVWLMVRGPAVTINAATYAGVDLVPIGSHVHPSANLSIHAFYLPGPTAGSNTLAITPSATSGRQFIVHHVAFVGADQDDPLDDFAFADGTSAAPAVTLDPTEDGELLLGAVLHEGTNANTVGDGETSLGDADHGAYVSSASYAIQETAAQQVMDWTNGQSDRWVAAAASFKVAADANTPPTVTLDTPDEAELDETPTLLFTGTDEQGDDIRYQIQISDSPEFIGGVNLQDYNGLDDNSGGFHENGADALTWQGHYQVDDRFGHSFVAHGGYLVKVATWIDTSEAIDVDGTAIARIYAIQGTPGVDAAPLNPADPADTPTPGWLAESDPLTIDSAFQAEREFVFSGANRIWLEAGVDYMVIFDWRPSTGVYSNLIELCTVPPEEHPGNTYIDGWGAANNGPYLAAGLRFAIYEENILLDRLSGTDSGFANEDNGGDSDPFTSGDQVSFTVQAGDALPDGAYYWRVRAVDPDGSGAFGEWSETRSFTVGEGLIGASASGSSTVIASITATGNAVAASDGTSTASAGIQGLADIVASADGTSTAVALLDSPGNVVASGDGTSTAAAAVTGETTLVANADGIASATVTIVGYGDLVATSDGTSTAAAAIVAAGSSDMAGVAQGMSTATVAITAAGTTVAAASGISTASVNLTGIAHTVAASDGVATAVVSILGYFDTVAAADGTSTADALITYLADGDIIASAAGTSAATVAITADGYVVAASSGTSASSALIQGILNTQDIAGSAAGSTTATVSIGGRGTIYCVSTGTSTVTALITSSGTINLVATSAGTSTAAAIINNGLAELYGVVVAYDESVYDVAGVDEVVYSVALVDSDQPS